MSSGNKNKAKYAGIIVALRGVASIIAIIYSSLANGPSLTSLLNITFGIAYLLSGIAVIADAKKGYIVAGALLTLEVFFSTITFDIISLAIDLPILFALIAGFTTDNI